MITLVNVWYNLFCLDEQSTGALSFLEAADRVSQLSIASEAPFANGGLTSPAVRLGNGSAICGGRFAMFKKCSKCGKIKLLGEFSRNRTRKDGYSHRCKVCESTHEYTPNRTCEICGKPFYASPSNVKKGLGRFCSKACMGKSRDRRVTQNCAICGKEYLIHAYEAEQGLGRFCSKSCEGRWRAGPRGPRWMGGNLKVICQNCGTEFPIRRYREGKAKFCSPKCKGEWMAKNIVGENHHHWRGGYSIKDYPTAWNESFREAIRLRDGRQCAICGKYGNHVHHINYIKHDTNPLNCITLCRSCHPKTNFNREYWQELFSAIVSDYEVR